MTFSLALSIIGSDSLLPICFWLSAKSEAAWFLCIYFRTSLSSFPPLLLITTAFATGFRRFTYFFGLNVHNTLKSMQDEDSFIWKFLFSNNLLSHLYICASILVGMHIGRIAITTWKRKALGYWFFLKLLFFSCLCVEKLANFLKLSRLRILAKW